MLSKMASAAPESLTIQKQITESLWTSQCSGKEARDEIVLGVCYGLFRTVIYTLCFKKLLFFKVIKLFSCRKT